MAEDEGFAFTHFLGMSLAFEMRPECLGPKFPTPSPKSQAAMEPL